MTEVYVIEPGLVALTYESYIQACKERGIKPEYPETV